LISNRRKRPLTAFLLNAKLVAAAREESVKS
jgi:hypothetical protein